MSWACNFTYQCHMANVKQHFLFSSGINTTWLFLGKDCTDLEPHSLGWNWSVWSTPQPWLSPLLGLMLCYPLALIVSYWFRWIYTWNTHADTEQLLMCLHETPRILTEWWHLKLRERSRACWAAQHHYSRKLLANANKLLEVKCFAQGYLFSSCTFLNLQVVNWNGSRWRRCSDDNNVRFFETWNQYKDSFLFPSLMAWE